MNTRAIVSLVNEETRNRVQLCVQPKPGGFGDLDGACRLPSGGSSPIRAEPCTGRFGGCMRWRHQVPHSWIRVVGPGSFSWEAAAAVAARALVARRPASATAGRSIYAGMYIIRMYLARTEHGFITCEQMQMTTPGSEPDMAACVAPCLRGRALSFQSRQTGGAEAASDRGARRSGPRGSLGCFMPAWGREPC